MKKYNIFSNKGLSNPTDLYINSNNKISENLFLELSNVDIESFKTILITRNSCEDSDSKKGVEIVDGRKDKDCVRWLCIK